MKCVEGGGDNLITRGEGGDGGGKKRPSLIIFSCSKGGTTDLEYNIYVYENRL